MMASIFYHSISKKMTQKTFTQKVYDVAQNISKGKVMTYQEVAKLAGNAKAARAVGTAMKNNPDRTTILCHRVVGATGSMNGYAFGGEASKIQILKKEGVKFRGDKVDLIASRAKIVPPSFSTDIIM